MSGDLVPPAPGEFLLYQSDDGRSRLEIRFDGETLWLTQAQMAELFQTTPQNITLHLRAVFAEGELDQAATCKEFLQVRQEGARTVTRALQHYALPAILAVGMRVRSVRGTQFRQWAIARLDEYLRKGFVMDDERLRNPPGPGVPDYFDELLERIRDIRASERRMYLRVRDTLALAADYVPSADATSRVFQTVQNKLHFAVTKLTAPEIIAQRVNADAPNMGLTAFDGAQVRRRDVTVAKSYLLEPEITELNRIVSMFLDFAEDQASRRKQVFLRDWEQKLDDFLRFNERAVLTDGGSVSRPEADRRALAAYDEFDARRRAEMEAAAERDSMAELERAAKALPKQAKKRDARGGSRELSRYPEYKDSGVEWLGLVPAHWGVPRLRFAAQLNPSKGEVRQFSPETLVSFLPMEAIGEDGSIDLGRQRMLADVAEGYTYFRDGDVVLAKITPCFENGKGAVMRGLENGIGFGTTELIVVRPEERKLSPSFLHYLFTSPPFRQAGESRMYGAGGQKRVPDSFVRDAVIPLPSAEEQGRISSFLDRETAKIDALVAEQERLIALLKEKRHAVISHAVTKGLNPDAPMKDSGIDWLGDIPTHWSVIQSRRLFRVRSEKALPSDEQLTASQRYGIIRQVDFVEREGRRVVETILGKENLLHVEPDDFVISMRSFQGGIERSTLRGSISFHYVMLVPQSRVYPAFFAHALKCRPYIHALQSTTDLIRDGQELRFSHFARVALPLLPLSEQQEIAEFLDRELHGMDSLIAQAEESRPLLHERRRTLIAAAVTGQIDVRGLAPAESA